VANVYTNGLLTSVSGFATLGYNANGTLGTVTHSNSAGLDTIGQNPNGMPRPNSIEYTGWTTPPSCPPPNVPSITTAPPVCSGSLNNGASVTAPDTQLTYSWSISGGPGAAIINQPPTGTSITYNAGTGANATLSVTATKSCGSAATGNVVVTVAPRPTAVVSGGGASPGQIRADLTGTPPWTVTWSDTVSQTVNFPFTAAIRTVTPPTTTSYTVTALTDASSSCNTGTSSGSATVTIPPTNVIARTQDANSRVVHISWGLAPGATAYRIERALCLSCWGAVFVSNSATIASYDDTVPVPSAAQPVVTYLYRVVALNGTTESASAIDFATTATTLFAEPIVGGFTLIRGNHVKELRNAIDAVRISAGIGAYSGWTGWPASYTPATGPILGADVGAMRLALDQALYALKSSHLPTTANPSGRILAVHFNDLREGVR
jgi:hypothetical protein